MVLCNETGLRKEEKFVPTTNTEAETSEHVAEATRTAWIQLFHGRTQSYDQIVDLRQSVCARIMEMEMVLAATERHYR